MDTVHHQVETASLDIAYEETGPPDGKPIVLLHGFPYDVRQYDAVRDALAHPGRRILVPYLRGYGPTRYRDATIFRSGQQAALGKDVVDFLDALKIQRAIVAGYDWGGRAACVAAAIWPDRISGLLSASAYAIQNIPQAAATPRPAKAAYALWYQSYLNTKQGEIALEADREDLCRLLWSLWSPGWRFTQDEFLRTARSFQNPDFVATVIQSYRHRWANAPGDPALEEIEAQLAASPAISAPTIVVHGAADGVESPDSLEGNEHHFEGPYEVRILEHVGHCVCAEAPEAFAAAIESLLA